MQFSIVLSNIPLITSRKPDSAKPVIERLSLWFYHCADGVIELVLSLSWLFLSWLHHCATNIIIIFCGFLIILALQVIDNHCVSIIVWLSLCDYHQCVTIVMALYVRWVYDTDRWLMRAEIVCTGIVTSVRWSCLHTNLSIWDSTATGTHCWHSLVNCRMCDLRRFPYSGNFSVVG